MDDLISRRAAIEALQKCRKHCIDPFDSYHIDIQDAEYQLSKLPTIQPQSTAGQPNDSARSTVQSTDLIDRQQAIDALDCINGVEEVLRSLPPVQPEPKEGEWVQVSAQKYFTSASYFYRCSVCGENNTRNTKYCPNCGADMRGEKNE